MNQKYIRFGWAGARLDDLINFIPARLSVVILFLGSYICRLHPVDGFRRAMKDRLKHDSPNSAHAESFVAGALNVRLGGPTRYREGLKEKPWIGESYLDPGPEQIAMTTRLLLYCGWIAVLIPILLLFTFNYFLVQ
jgi:adenosylcobinamide-phosphate synthase